MRITFIVPLAIYLLAFSACKKDEPLYAPALEQQLAGKNQVRLDVFQQQPVIQTIRDSAHLPFPVYAANGERLSRDQIRSQRINMCVDVFKDSLNQIEAVVFRKMTPAELAERMEQTGRRHDAQEQWIHSWIGKQAPEIIAKDIHGNPVDPTTLKGKTVVLNFWFTRCHACVEEMPELNQLVEEFGPRNVVFLGITFDPEERTRDFLSKNKFDYQVIAQGKYLFDRFGIGPCPVDIVIGPDGKITYAEMGYESALQMSYQQLRKAIRRTVLGKDNP